MRAFHPISACLAFALGSLTAQDIAPKDSERDIVLSALTEGFEDEEGPSVTVDISATEPSLGDGGSGEQDDETGEEPAGTGLDEPADEPTDERVAADAEPEPEGVTVNVEPGRDGAAMVDAAAVKLLAPFPAKPLFQAPPGWRLEHPENVPPFVEKVALANGTSISLSIRPHLLVPDADGHDVLAVVEPGYDPELRYAQTGTMGAVLSSSVERMEADSRRMGEALERLGQLLGSLPAADEPPAKEPTTTKKQR